MIPLQVEGAVCAPGGATTMEGPFQIIVYLATCFAFFSPLIFIAVRESIKKHRQEIITDLATVFDIGDPAGTNLIPSFEFVKYKYFVGARRSRDPAAGRAEGERSTVWAAETRGKREDYSVIAWIIGSAPFGILAATSTFYGLSLLLSVLAEHMTEPSGLRWGGFSYPTPTGVGMVWLLGICAAFAGSYITALRSLYRAIKNFDLSPGMIANETNKILISFVLGPIVFTSIIWFGSQLVTLVVPVSPAVTAAAAITACFVAGVMPEVVLRSIIQRDQLKNFKREEEEVFRAFKITPVEIVDGIDSEIRVRLDDHHIHSTQNLAAANPLMLFVETPYGVYQIMDWVAQAQLCCSVGRDKIVRLWPLGVRTLFDLERLAAGKDLAKDALLLEVGRIILGEALVPLDPKDRAATAALVRASIELRLDDPHVQRLRQIYIAVGDRLGSKSRRFRGGGYRVLCRNRSRKGWICRGIRAERA